jgi:hypothetical protein
MSQSSILRLHQELHRKPRLVVGEAAPLSTGFGGYLRRLAEVPGRWTKFETRSSLVIIATFVAALITLPIASLGSAWTLAGFGLMGAQLAYRFAMEGVMGSVRTRLRQDVWADPSVAARWNARAENHPEWAPHIRAWLREVRTVGEATTVEEAWREWEAEQKILSQVMNAPIEDVGLAWHRAAAGRAAVAQDEEEAVLAALPAPAMSLPASASPVRTRAAERSMAS